MGMYIFCNKVAFRCHYLQQYYIYSKCYQIKVVYTYKHCEQDNVYYVIIYIIYVSDWKWPAYNYGVYMYGIGT